MKKLRRKLPARFPSYGSDNVEENCLLREYQKPLIVLTMIIGMGDASVFEQLPVRILYNVYKVAVIAIALYLPAVSISITKWNGRVNPDTCSMLMSFSWLFATAVSIGSLSYTFGLGRLSTLWKQIKTHGVDDRLTDLEWTGKLKRGVRVIYVLCSVQMVSTILVKLVVNVDLLITEHLGWFSKQFQWEEYQFLFLPIVTNTILYLMHTNYLIVCYYLAKSWDSYASMLSRKFSAELSESTVHWALIKRQQIEDVSKTVSRLFCWYCTLLLPLSTLTSIMYLYRFLTDDTRFSQRLYAAVFGSLFHICQIAVVCFGVRINSAASTTCDQICRSIVGQLCKRQQLDGCQHMEILYKIEILLSKLRNQQIGIYICGVGVLNKSILIIIFSASFSYFFLLLQFSSRNSASYHTVHNQSVF